ncbi:MAG TPA: hypothetical protein VGX28_08750 [Frankiaceae bacterium]|jgi:hypothetical protein|nr:hypothetical protein [Frankiaceae bacterium]
MGDDRRQDREAAQIEKAAEKIEKAAEKLERASENIQHSDESLVGSIYDIDRGGSGTGQGSTT